MQHLGDMELTQIWHEFDLGFVMDSTFEVTSMYIAKGSIGIVNVDSRFAVESTYNRRAIDVDSI